MSFLEVWKPGQMGFQGLSLLITPFQKEPEKEAIVPKITFKV